VSPAQRRYILLEQGVGAAVFNFVLNALIAWVMFRSQDVVPLWGQQSIMADTIGTTIILPLMTSLIATPLARRRVRTGGLDWLGWSRLSHPFLAWLPRSTAARGFALGLACMIALAPVTLLILGYLHVAELSLGRFVVFKATFAAVAAALVTPIIALWAIAEDPAT
jgi:hypothetical protein